MGEYTSIAAVGAGTIYISHRDDTNDDLRIAKSGGNIVVTVEPRDDVASGFYTLSGRLAQTEQ